MPEDFDVTERVAHELVARLVSQRRGPVFGRGPGRPWRGIVERTLCLWVTWITEACRRVGVSPGDLGVSFAGERLETTTVELTFGERWYWVCPRCGRRCEVVYYAGEVGCRVCLRLGYVSQCHQRTSPWLLLWRILTFDHGPRRHWAPSKEAVASMVRERVGCIQELVAGIDAGALRTGEPTGSASG